MYHFHCFTVLLLKKQAGVCVCVCVRSDTCPQEAGLCVYVYEMKLSWCQEHSLVQRTPWLALPGASANKEVVMLLARKREVRSCLSAQHIRAPARSTYKFLAARLLQGQEEGTWAASVSRSSSEKFPFKKLSLNYWKRIVPWVL